MIYNDHESKSLFGLLTNSPDRVRTIKSNLSSGEGGFMKVKVLLHTCCVSMLETSYFFKFPGNVIKGASSIDTHKSILI